MYECFHCGMRGVIWDSDYNGEDLGRPPGIIHLCHCENCGAEIEYYLPITIEEENNDEEDRAAVYHEAL